MQLAGLYRRAGKIDEAREVLQMALIPTANSFEVTLELADLEIEPFRRNLAISVDIDEGPQSIRKLPYPEIKIFASPESPLKNGRF